MPPEYHRRRSFESQPIGQNYSSLEKKRILIVVKAAPLPSKQYLETVCTAGIDSSGNWCRLYPLPFRHMGWNSRFVKYQWIEVDVAPVDKTRDDRKESFRPVITSIKPVGKPLPRGKWTERKSLIFPLVKPSVEALAEQYAIDKSSLGIIKPKEMVDFTAEKDEEYWTRSKAIAQTQLKLFGSQPKELEKIPYKFYYHFRCQDTRCCHLHRMSIHDWEIYMLYLRLKNDYGYAEDVILSKMKGLWFEKMWSQSRDSHLFLGTVHAQYKKPIFVVLGVFWPPK